MSKIKVLSKQLADKIAAGEVVERPASVVKELLENSLDAASNRIEIIVEDAGLLLIKVIDDGDGIEADDLKQACLRHATSKINSDSDLTNIVTLGFRGEALASIAAVSRLTICTSTQAAKGAMQLYSEDGKIKNITKTARTQGTTVEVCNLFYNTPARLKFLKSKATEMAHISRIITELALVNSEVAFKLTHNNNVIIDCAANQSVLQRIEVILGKEFAKELIPISLNVKPLKISGYVGRAGCGYSNRKHQYLFVNNRSVADKTISHAIIQGYHTFLMERKFPPVLIFIQTASELVDVNVHPSKREVRFQQASILHDMLAKVIKDALVDKTNLPNIMDDQKNSFSGLSGISLSQGSGSFKRDYVETNQAQEKMFSGLAQPQALFANQDDQISASGCPAKYLQVHGTYIIKQDDKGLVIIDQHAAHERVIFDELLKQFKEKKVEKQKLLLPITLHFSAQEFILINEHKDAFAQLGFEIEDFGNNTLAIYSYPAILGKIDIKAEFQTIAGEIAEFDISPDLEKKVAQFLAPIACHSAVRAHEELSPVKMESLLQRLWKTDSPYTCPHGRPTVITMSLVELERKFKRK